MLSNLRNKKFPLFLWGTFFLTFGVIFFLGEIFSTFYFYTHNELKTRGNAILYRQNKRVSSLTPENRGRELENTLVIHPFFGYVYNSKLQGVNNYGFKTLYPFALCGTRYCLDKTFNRPLVVGIFGGSFAEVTGYESNYLEKRLAEIFPEQTPVVINFGIAGHALPQAFYIFTYFRDFLDIAVFVDGLNELINPIQNNQAESPPEFAKAVHFKYKLSLTELTPRNYRLTSQILRLKKIDLWVTHFSLLPLFRHSLFIHYVWSAADRFANDRMQVKMMQLTEGYLEGKRFFDVPDGALLELGAQKWFSYHQLIHQIAVSSGILDLHLIQPNPFVEGSKKLTGKENFLIHHSYDIEWQVVTGYPKLRESLGKLQKEKTVAEDLSWLFAHEKESIWTDSAHTNPRGARMVLDKVFELIQQNGRSKF